MTKMKSTPETVNSTPSSITRRPTKKRLDRRCDDGVWCNDGLIRKILRLVSLVQKRDKFL